MTFPAGPTRYLLKKTGLVASEWGHYSLRHALTTSGAAAADVTGGNDSGVRWLSDTRRKGSFQAQAEVASGTPSRGRAGQRPMGQPAPRDKAETRGTACNGGQGSSPAPGGTGAAAPSSKGLASDGVTQRPGI